MTEDTSVGPQDGVDVVSIDGLQDSQFERDRDGARSLRDSEESSGDEDGVSDTYDLDEREAREAGVRLDGGTDDEASLD